MAEKLVHYYALAKERGGIGMQLKLALRTGMALPVAAKVPDSPEVLAKFRQALAELLPGEPIP
jgi:hypothetical protein